MSATSLAAGTLSLLALNLLLNLSPFPALLLPAAELLLGTSLILLLPRPPTALMAAVFWFLLLLLGITEELLLLQLGRPLRPVDDLRLLWVVWDVLWEVLPAPLGPVLLAGAVLLLSALAGLCALAARSLLELAPKGHKLALPLLALSLAGPMLPGPPLSYAATERVQDQLARAREGRAGLARIRAELSRRPSKPFARDVEGSALAVRDVWILFVESYGRSAIEREDLRVRLLPRLEALSRRAEALGLEAASGYLTSPAAGGQSWLAHATLLTGLWIDRQESYALVTRNRPPSLADLFAASGHRTLLVAPAVARPWPQGKAFGFERVITAPDLGYRGPRFGFGRIPDQFTLESLFRSELAARPRRPVFAVLLLASSHSPFLPLPKLLPWDELGSGEVFARLPQEGAEASLWFRPRRLREAYGRALSYVFETIDSFLAFRPLPCTLLILLGDHEPPAWVLGQVPGREVPVHVLADDRRLLRPFLARGLVPGLIPDSRSTALPMSALFALLEEARELPASSHCRGRFTPPAPARARGERTGGEDRRG